MKQRKWLVQLSRRRFVIAVLIVFQLAVMLYTMISNTRESEILRSLLSTLSLITAIQVLSSRMNGAYKSSLIFLILLFPVFGGFFYLFFKWQTGLRKMHKSLSEIQMQTKEHFLTSDTARQNAIASAREHENQIKYLDRRAGFGVYENTKTEYFPLGEDMFSALYNELEKAERYIFLEYFIIHVGEVWDKLYALLEEKAKNGVDVRIIYDDLGCFLGLPHELTKSGNSHIKRASFNPFVPFLSGVQNNRDHRKIAVIDGTTAFTGGLNIADEYANKIEKHGHWKDNAVMLKGSGAWSFAVMFLQMWSVVSKENVNFPDFYPKAMPVYADSGFVLPYSDSPADDENVSEHVYLRMISSAKEYVYITTPYLIIDDSMMSALTLSAKSGIDVRIITPCHYDKYWVHRTTRSYYRRLIESGVKIYEYTPGFIHAKSFVCDDISATVGTANLDYRSLYFHFECGVWMYKTEVVKKLRDDFTETLKKCKEITLSDCKRGVAGRTLDACLRIFAPLM